MTRFTLLGSVYLPATVLQPLAQALTQRGHEVAIAIPDAVDTVEHVLDGYAAGIGPGAVLVAHSNAGNYVPALARRTGAVGAVFVDAVLPPFEGGTWRVVPAEAAARLRETAADGRLPRWTRWWPREQAEALFGSAAEFERVDAATPEVPVGYLGLEASADPVWADALPCAYLSLSDAYPDEVRRAGASGMPTSALAFGHLGMLQHPDAVAQVVLDLAGRL